MLCKVLHEVRCTLSNTTEHAIQMPDKSTDNRVGRYLNTYIPYHEKRNEDKQGLFVCLGLSICPFSTGKYSNLRRDAVLLCSLSHRHGGLLADVLCWSPRPSPSQACVFLVRINHNHNTLQARVSVCMVVS